jgi:hypothetical protein
LLQSAVKIAVVPNLPSESFPASLFARHHQKSFRFNHCQKITDTIQLRTEIA